jgi:hypothetical protein
MIATFLCIWLGGALVSWLLLSPVLREMLDELYESNKDFQALEPSVRASFEAILLLIGSLGWPYFFPVAVFNRLKAQLGDKDE